LACEGGLEFGALFLPAVPPALSHSVFDSASHPNLGLTSINSGFNSYPEMMHRFAQTAEKTSFDSLCPGGYSFLSEKQTRRSIRLSQLT